MKKRSADFMPLELYYLQNHLNFQYHKNHFDENIFSHTDFNFWTFFDVFKNFGKWNELVEIQFGKRYVLLHEKYITHRQLKGLSILVTVMELFKLIQLFSNCHSTFDGTFLQ